LDELHEVSSFGAAEVSEMKANGGPPFGPQVFSRSCQQDHLGQVRFSDFPKIKRGRMQPAFLDVMVERREKGGFE
jgi:hypothetical protein